MAPLRHKYKFMSSDDYQFKYNRLLIEHRLALRRINRLERKLRRIHEEVSEYAPIIDEELAAEIEDEFLG